MDVVPAFSEELSLVLDDAIFARRLSGQVPRVYDDDSHLETSPPSVAISGPRPLAASDERDGVLNAGTAFDVARRDRLAAAGAHAGAAAGGVSKNYQQLICQEFRCLAYCAHDE